MKPTILSRQQLFEMVWSTPMSLLAKQFDISDNGLRKTCIRMHIPIPLAGHWQKIRAGKKVPIPILSSDYKGQVEVTFQPRSLAEEQRGPSALSVLQKEIESDKRLPIKLQAKLVDPDP